MKKMSWQEVYKQNLANKKLEELSALIERIKEIRLEEMNSQRTSANECNMLLMACYNEQSRRSAKKLGDAALWATVLSTGAALLSLLLAVKVYRMGSDSSPLVHCDSVLSCLLSSACYLF